MKVAVCPLVSHDLIRAKRCVASCLCQQENDHGVDFAVVVHINTRNQEFGAQMADFCKELGVRHLRTNSDGTPSTGKNGILDFISKSDFDGATLLDGDDIYYPCSLSQIARHLAQFPETDLLSNCAMDSLELDSRYPNAQELPEIQPGVRAVCWGSNDWKVGVSYKTCPSRLLDPDAPPWPIAIGMQQFFSKRLAKRLRFDPGQLIGEDVLLENQVLERHQRGDLAFFRTFCSDMYIYDRTLDNNIQTANAGLKRSCWERIKEKLSFPDLSRSSIEEVPCSFPPLAYNYADKISFIGGLFPKT